MENFTHFFGWAIPLLWTMLYIKQMYSNTFLRKSVLYSVYHNTYVWLLPLHSITLKEVCLQTPWAERCRQHVLGFTGTLTSQAQMRLGKSDPLEPPSHCDPNLTPLVLLVNTNSLVFLCAKGVCLNSSAYKIPAKALSVRPAHKLFCVSRGVYMVR